MAKKFFFLDRLISSQVVIGLSVIGFNRLTLFVPKGTLGCQYDLCWRWGNLWIQAQAGPSPSFSRSGDQATLKH